MLYNISEASAIDEVAAVYRDLESLSEALGKEHPTAQVSQKVVSCRDRCYLAFNHLGEEIKAYERKIESLQNEIQALGKNHVTTGKLNISM